MKSLRNYKIPSEVSAELKLNKYLYLTDLIMLLGLFMLRMLTIDYIHSSLRWVFTAFLIVVGIVLIIRPATNPQKRMFEAMSYALVSKRDAYVAIDYGQKECNTDGNVSAETK